MATQTAHQTSMARQTAQQAHDDPNKPHGRALFEPIQVNAVLVFPEIVVSFRNSNKDRPLPGKAFTTVILYDENKGYQAILRFWNGKIGAMGEFKPAGDRALLNLWHILGDTYRKRLVASLPEERKAVVEKGGWVAGAVPQAPQG